MDYCSSCRRHLNGALVCPGCGAYAPDIDPSADPGARRDHSASRGDNVWDDRSVWEETHTGTRELHLAYTGSAVGSAAPATDASGDSEHTDTGEATTDGYAAPQQGRAARRRQMARWKKNQRRAVVATAFALVGGGLTVAGMNGNATNTKQSATAPGDTAMGGTEGQAPTYTEPTSTRRDAPRSSPATAPDTGSASQRERSRAAAPRTTPADTRTDSGSAPRALPKTTQPKTTVPDTADSVTGSTGESTSTATERTTPPAADSGNDSQQSSDSAPPPPAASPTPAETPPANGTSNSKELCLLVVCLG
ncbi:MULTISPECIES: SCO2400 family protein [unclassified Streptomyces]|uniref:SCO2400 family protein n=1 Tax=unclassified Streptomyces TaxID=2593676 RepID=UPI0004BE55EF|nr:MULTISPECIES: hypothetical protein [unclassified Streptomyces]